MPATLSLTETQIIAALRSVMLDLLPDGMEVIRTEINRVPEPTGPDYATLTPTLRERIETNIDSFIDSQIAGPTATPGRRDSLIPTRITIQIDVYGPASADNAQILYTALRDEYATIAFNALAADVQPLYADEPRQSAFDNGEQQTEFRWSLDMVLQANIIVSTPQDFADEVVIDVQVPVDQIIP
jgi:hypothetical protein